MGMTGASLDSELFVTQWAKSSRGPCPPCCPALSFYSFFPEAQRSGGIFQEEYFLPLDIFSAHLGGLSLLKTLGPEFSQSRDSSHCFPLCECLPLFPLNV